MQFIYLHHSRLLDSHWHKHITAERHLTHLPLVTHVCVSALDQHWFRYCFGDSHAIAWTNADLISTGLIGTNSSEIDIEILWKCCLEIVAILSRAQCVWQPWMTWVIPTSTKTKQNKIRAAIYCHKCAAILMRKIFIDWHQNGEYKW